jgi:hypothetical protein
MNNCFFGDERDFFKYALLRILAFAGVNIGVCWMLTTGGRNGGDKLGYLKSGKHKEQDEVLFDFLRRCVCERRRRDVALLEEEWNGGAVIPRARFFRDEFLDSGRKEYFRKMRAEFADCDLIFFDPDTGIKPKTGGRNPPEEYLNWCDLQYVADAEKEKSLMIFQYFNPQSVTEQKEKRHGEIIARLRKIGGDGADIFSLWHSQIVYYFIARGELKERLVKCASDSQGGLGFEIRR